MNDENGLEQDQDFAAMLESSFSRQADIEPGSKVEANITSIGKEDVFLDLGTRQDGVIPRTELEGEQGLPVQPGDRLTVYVVGVRDGAIQCTQRMGASSAENRADREAVLAALTDAWQNEIPVEGKVAAVVKGGFQVNVMGQKAFCPISQMDTRYIEEPEVYVGQTYSFAILRIEEQGRNVVVSRRKILEAEAAEKQRAVWASLEEGATVDGVITSIRGYGAFVDIGSIEGLLHVSEISHGRVEDPRDLLQEGQRLQVLIKKIDPEEKKISLSTKALTTDPWIEAIESLAVDSVVSGTVSRLKPFGAFVEIAPGVDGLLHVSEMGSGRVNHPRDVVSEGQRIEVRILQIDEERKRISLALQTEEDRAEREYRRQKATAQKKSGGGADGLGTLGDVLSQALDKTTRKNENED
jgi:small subunit ribosomal protein S1